MPLQIFAFGSNGSGQLGIGNTDDTFEPTACRFPVSELTCRPAAVAAGGNHTLVRFEDGSLYAAGCNDNGRCGFKAFDQCGVTFKTVEFSTSAGSLVNRFKFATATWESSTFVTLDNRVFTSGSGTNGELGQGENVTESQEPREIPNFPPTGIEIIDVAACMRHTAVVLSNGGVYGWGAGRKGQIGDPKEKAVWSPRKINQLKAENGRICEYSASKVLCCRDSTYIISALMNEEAIEKANSPPTLEAPKDVALYVLHPEESWRDIVATWRGIHILGERGQIMTLGKYFTAPDLVSAHIRRLLAGSEHVLCETIDGKVLATGWGEHGNCGRPIDNKGMTEGWNEICYGNLLGGGCATSWVFKDVPG